MRWRPSPIFIVLRHPGHKNTQLVVINDSPDNPEKTQWRPEGRVEQWDHRQNAGVIGASGSNIRKDSPDEPKRTHQEPAEVIAGERTLAEAMVKGKSAGVTRATGGKLK